MTSLRITFWKGVFVADSLPEDKTTLERAGFLMHEPTLCEDKARCKACRAKIGRRHWTARIEDATRLRSHCNDIALKIMRDHLHKLEKSRAVDADIVVPAPPGLEYLPYQKAGISYAIQRKDTLIGDEAGLGKTVESLGVINKLKPKTVLVVAPATLAFNWKLEAEKWLVDPYEIFVPSTGSETIPQADRLFVITNYEKLVGRMKNGEECESDFAKSLKRTWDMGVFDECHALKNPQSKRSQAVLGEFGLMRRSHRTLFLSGTPIENYPKEIWPLAATICPAKFGDWWAFAKRYCTPPESPIWRGDYSFGPIGEVKIGDELIGWRKRPPTKTGHRRLELCRTTVTAITRRISPIVKVTTESGRTFRCTPDHRWMSGSKKKEIPWTSTKVGRAICHVIDPTPPIPPHLEGEARWLGGLFDGEGTGDRLSQSRSHNPEIHAHIGEVLAKLDLSGTPYDMGYYLTGGRKSALKFLNWCKPFKRTKRIDARILSTRFRTVDHITKVEPDGEGEVIGLTTTTGNYIVWGYASKNCGLHKEIRDDGHAAWVANGSSHLSELQQRLRTTFMVRRLKHDVLKELPPKRRQLVVLGENVDWSQHPEFRRWKAIYEREYEAALARIESAKTNEEYKKAIKALDAFVGIAFTEMSEFRHKTALAKLPMCLQYLDDLLKSSPDNIVIFAHHKDVLQKLAQHFGDEAVLLYGETKMEDRGKAVTLFQEGHKRIFIGGLKAAGIGLNLTRANTAVFVEIDWVPATMSQAEDRLCRYGQKKMVHVIHLVLNNTLDVNMSQKVISKQNTIDKALDRLPEQLRLQQIG